MPKSLPASRVHPVIRSLAGDECAALLLRNQVGRIAYSMNDRVDMEPIHYVYEAPWIYGRTSAGAKVLTLARNQWCAFECDEVEGLFDWQSVVVKGPFSTQGSRFAGWDVDRAVAALRRLVPGAFTTDDPTPHRDIVFGIHASEISGRGSVSSVTRIPVPLAVPAAVPIAASPGMARLTRLTLV